MKVEDAFSTGCKSSRVKAADESITTRHDLVLKKLKEAFEAVNPSGLTFQKLFYDCDT